MNGYLKWIALAIFVLGTVAAAATDRFQINDHGKRIPKAEDDIKQLQIDRAIGNERYLGIQRHQIETKRAQIKFQDETNANFKALFRELRK